MIGPFGKVRSVDGEPIHLPELTIAQDETLSPEMNTSRSSERFSWNVAHVGITIQRPVSGMFCSSSACPIRSRTSMISTCPVVGLRPTVPSGVPVTPRLIAGRDAVARDRPSKKPRFAASRLPKQSQQHVAINNDLHLLRCVVGPNGEVVDVRLFLDHVIQDRSEVFALIDGQFDARPLGAGAPDRR